MEIAPSPPNQATIAIQLCELTKIFPGVVALKKISLEVKKGEIRGLVGENGAGKSTAGQVISGVYPPTDGHMLLSGEPYHPHDVLDARKKGVTILYQEPTLVPNMRVAENIFLDSFSSFAKNGLLKWRTLFSEARRLLDAIGAIEIDVRSKANELTVAQKRFIELAHAISAKPRVLIVDETTAALNAIEVDRLFVILKKLKAQGTSIIYISHRLEEIFHLCDSVTVLRDGEVVRTIDTCKTDIDELMSLMVGREIDLETYYRDRSNNGTGNSQEKPVLEVQALTCNGRFKDISLTVNKGEIVGIGGLIGSGSEDVLKAIFGLLRIDSGRLLLDGRNIGIRSPSDAVEKGIAYVPKERDEEGLVTVFSVKENTCMVVLARLVKALILLDRGKMAQITSEYKSKLSIKAPSIETVCLALSGGNRQKVVLGKWLTSNPIIMLLNNPTRGIDVGAKREVYKLITELAKAGLGVLMACDEMPELIGMSDKILILKKGKISKIFERCQNIKEDEIIPWMI